MRTGKSCPDCGGALQSVPWVGGVVWECTDHGVRDWCFDADAGLDADAPFPARRGDAAAPALRVRAPARLDARDRFLDARGR